MVVTLSTASLYMYPLAAVFKLVASAGFDGVELAVNPEVMLRGPKPIRELSRSYGLPVFSVHPPLFRTVRPLSRSEAYARSVELANELSAGVVTFHGPEASSFGDAGAQRWMEDVLRARENCRPGLRIGIENSAVPGQRPTDPIPAIADPRLWNEFLDTHGFDVTFDTAHAGALGLDLMSVARASLHRLANVHLSNVSNRGFPYHLPMLLSLFVQHQLPQQGRLPLSALLAFLHQAHFTGPVTLEVSPFALHFWNPLSVPALLRASQQFCRQPIASAA